MNQTLRRPRTPAIRLPDTATLLDRLRTSSLMDCRGRVASATGSTIELEGMAVEIGAICELRTRGGRLHHGQVIGFRGTSPLITLFDAAAPVAAGDWVRRIDEGLRVPYGEALAGRILGPLGQPIDGRPLPPAVQWTDAHRRAPEPLSRPAIDAPMQTGVRAIDAMLTCGRGGRIGIFAGSGVGKSTLMGMLARGCDADRIVIALVGERGREVQDFVDESLGAAGRARSVMVVATSDRSPLERMTAAKTATAIAEGFRDRGENVLLLVDSLTRFAIAARELGLAAGEPPTTRGYPPSVFNQLPSLVERAGRNRRGSITAFYTVLVEGDDMNEPIADAVRGLLDGHIVLDRKIASRGHYPPIDVVESLSRLQPKLLSPEALAESAEARRHLAIYRENEDLIAIGAYRSGSDPRIDAAIAAHPPLNQFLQQRPAEQTDAATTSAALKAALLIGSQSSNHPSLSGPANSSVATTTPSNPDATSVATNSPTAATAHGVTNTTSAGGGNEVAS